jgi:hypothetical protein
MFIRQSLLEIQVPLSTGEGHEKSFFSQSLLRTMMKMFIEQSLLEM